MNHKIVRWAGAACALFGLSTSCLTQGLTKADPAGAGFSPARLERIAPWYQSQFEKNAATAAVIAIARGDRYAGSPAHRVQGQ